MLEIIISNAVGLVLGGGVVSLFTLRATRRLKNAESRLAEVDANKNTIDLLNKDVQLLMKREEERIKVQDMLCATCTYKQFFLKAEKRMHEMIKTNEFIKKGDFLGAGIVPDVPVDLLHAPTEAYKAD